MGQLFDGLKDILGAGLAFFYDVVPSFGIAIILLTIAVNLVVFPLTLKQTRSTRAFQAIQPEVRRVQKELKERPEEMQKELMRIQREAGATPGGCLLPLLVQFPIWIGLFQLLQSRANIPEGSALAAAIARGETHFIGMELGTRVSDAVAAGVGGAIPYVLMLAIMVATQYVQQWHATAGQIKADNPQAAATQAITRIMPLFIGFVSYNFPAGLVLYWTTSNIFRFLQQIVIFRIDGRPQPVQATESKPRPEETESNNKTSRPQPGSAERRRRRKRK
jgi:YidC/Oxa1 family membrane protein insertase